MERVSCFNPLTEGESYHIYYMSVNYSVQRIRASIGPDSTEVVRLGSVSRLRHLFQLSSEYLCIPAFPYVPKNQDQDNVLDHCLFEPFCPSLEAILELTKGFQSISSSAKLQQPAHKKNTILNKSFK